MCGIAGAAWTTQGDPLTPGILQKMTDAIRHRGPDDEGQYYSTGNGSSRQPGAALGFRRLSIIDLDSGHQPLANEDQTIWVAFNGEIYNYRELRTQLEADGHQFRTQSDTETIVHLYEQHGLEFLQHLRGMFALALWDDRDRKLILARDRIGQKPLFYRLEDHRLLFASELKALLQVPGTPRDLDLESLDLFLTYQYVPHPRCVLKGYSKLPPAHVAIYADGDFHVERYWTPPYDDVDVTHRRNPVISKDRVSHGRENWSDAQWSQALREQLTEAVRLRMRSDVPIGAFLSGGIDSTIIAGLMQSLAEQPIHTFSIGFPIKQFDETHYAREAAELLGTNHHEYIVDPSALDSLPKLAWHYDEPFGDSSAIPTMYLSEVTRREVTVALSGDGGDELFCGYPRYLAARHAARIDRMPGWFRSLCGWSGWQKMPASVKQRSFRRRLKRFLEALAQPAEDRYLRWIGIFDARWREQLLSDDVRGELGQFEAAEFIRSAYALCTTRDIVTRTTAADVHSYLPCDILTKVDIASMAHSLEARSPFLDHHVAELAAHMPLRLKQRENRGKLILTETFRDLLPASIQTRPKMGFGVPIDHWFRNELKDLLHDTLLDDTARNRGYFNMETVQRLIDEHHTEKFDHAYRLWNLLIFEQWCRTWLD